MSHRLLIFVILPVDLYPLPCPVRGEGAGPWGCGGRGCVRLLLYGPMTTACLRLGWGSWASQLICSLASARCFHPFLGQLVLFRTHVAASSTPQQTFCLCLSGGGDSSQLTVGRWTGEFHIPYIA